MQLLQAGLDAVTLCSEFDLEKAWIHGKGCKGNNANTCRLDSRKISQWDGSSENLREQQSF